MRGAGPNAPVGAGRATHQGAAAKAAAAAAEARPCSAEEVRASSATPGRRGRLRPSEWWGRGAEGRDRGRGAGRWPRKGRHFPAPPSATRAPGPAPAPPPAGLSRPQPTRRQRRRGLSPARPSVLLGAVLEAGAARVLPLRGYAAQALPRPGLSPRGHRERALGRDVLHQRRAGLASVPAGPEPWEKHDLWEPRGGHTSRIRG